MADRNKGSAVLMDWFKRHYPFNAGQTVNIFGEFGPLMAMFIVNFAIGIYAGVWALIVTTFLSMGVMYRVLRRLPVFPFIAGTVTIVCGVATLVTGDTMWIKIKVTIFNFVFAIFLWGGLMAGHNFFQYILHQTFHYTKEGWRQFTHNFAIFFLLTALANEYVRIGYSDDVWISFKLFFVMPAGGFFAWWQTKLMGKFKLDPPDTQVAAAAPAQEAPTSMTTHKALPATSGKKLAKPGDLNFTRATD